MQVEQALKDLGSEDQKKNWQAEMTLRGLSEGAKGAEAAKLASQLAEVLTKKKRHEWEERGKKKAEDRYVYSETARAKVCRYLAQVGTDAEVPALKQAATETADNDSHTHTALDLDIMEMARYALDTMIHSAAATKALQELVLISCGPTYRIGLINALSKRSGSDVVATLKTCTEDPSPCIRMAAVCALADQGEIEADALIVKFLGQPWPMAERAKARLGVSRVRLGAALAKAGKKEAAIKLFQAIVANPVDQAQKKAAENSLRMLQGQVARG